MNLCAVLIAWTLLALVGGQDLFLASEAHSKAHKSKPNIVLFLTDDQDQLLGGSFPVHSHDPTPMPKTKRLMQDEGAYATNWYVHTPICSPSRAELLTGRYFHNLKKIGGPGDPDMHVNYTIVNQHNFPKILKEEAGYATGLFGKYTNVLPSVGAAPGFDAWLANGGGDYIAPSFKTQGIDGLPDGENHFSSDPAHYSTAVIGNYSVAWIKKVAKQGLPFYAHIAPKAAHEPFNPAPWHADHWDPSWPDHEPRPENWNCSIESRKKHHGNIATEPLITEAASRMITGIFKNRWRTLMAVDDLIAEVIQTVGDLGLLDSTYFFYTSDNGFQLGQFNIPFDKRHVYEWDQKVHLLARGPGVSAGSSFPVPATHVDLAPTFLGLAGVSAPSSMDGRSIVPFLVKRAAAVESTQLHLKELGDLDTYKASWRRDVFFEYYFCDYNMKCSQPCTADLWPSKYDYPNSDSDCADVAKNADCWCTGYPIRQVEPSCYATETPANNFIALRQFHDAGRGALYAEFQTGDLGKREINFAEDEVDFVEYYNMTADPWHMRNIVSSLTESARATMHKRLHRWLACSGTACP